MPLIISSAYLFLNVSGSETGIFDSLKLIITLFAGQGNGLA